MKYRECDQIGADTIEAETRAVEKFGVAVHLDIWLVEQLVRLVARRYGYGTEFERLLEEALDSAAPFTNDAERGGYKIALGIIFSRRRHHERAQMRELEISRPFAPREQET